MRGSENQESIKKGGRFPSASFTSNVSIGVKLNNIIEQIVPPLFYSLDEISTKIVF